ncbi:dimethylamine monooxygenase subunit DmmA family protein [Pararhizobium sp.]|uniref:dimethylamine monooxygenase subunit DmmA family protein n=1 Tax=Pararhizobium sp. TaxID=1977563 RepID=UPI002722E943|nr:dimethylamine monooxygenase subunit DmmA family protein [Pararhizobium sp.]MDO9416680.1 dimethylamine monooxygenase subunit DmmA family protein [Pararhizobium sp.]
MLVQGIKSRPEYKGLDIDPHAKRHLFVLEGEGAMALSDQVDAAGRNFLPRSEILYLAAGAAPKGYDSLLSGLSPDVFWQAPTLQPLLFRFRACLEQARMGTRLYIAGTEGFIGQVMQVALEFGIDFNSIRTEHRGSLARRVQCVHCKGITGDVTTSPFACSHCGLPLLVRDHYSRRLGAFQGVNIDAEEPGTAPEPEEIFP